MRAVIYRAPGPSTVLEVVERPVPQPGAGEVRVRVHVCGVNPTDWKARSGAPLAFPEAVPNQDGAGVIDAVGAGVDAARIGEPVWIWEAAYQRADGTAQEFVVLPSAQAVALPDGVSLDLGASLGIPFLTAHRCLTINDGGPDKLAPSALDGRIVLVAGGAGAVGNATIQLARWSGATVITTVSSAEKAVLAMAAGADRVINYREQDVASEVHRIAPDGVATIVEVAPATNAAVDAQVLARHGAVAIYANSGGDEIVLPFRPLLAPNARWQFILVYTEPPQAKAQAVADVSTAVAAGAVRVGREAGLPLHRFPLEQTGAAQDAVEAGAVGKVLIDVG